MKKISIGRLMVFIGILVLSIGLICNAFEFVTIMVFRIIVLVGIIIEVLALVLILKKNEF